MRLHVERFVFVLALARPFEVLRQPFDAVLERRYLLLERGDLFVVDGAQGEKACVEGALLLAHREAEAVPVLTHFSSYLLFFSPNFF